VLLGVLLGVLLRMLRITEKRIAAARQAPRPLSIGSDEPRRVKALAQDLATPRARPKPRPRRRAPAGNGRSGGYAVGCGATLR